MAQSRLKSSTQVLLDVGREGHPDVLRGAAAAGLDVVQVRLELDRGDVALGREAEFHRAKHRAAALGGLGGRRRRRDDGAGALGVEHAPGRQFDHAFRSSPWCLPRAAAVAARDAAARIPGRRELTSPAARRASSAAAAAARMGVPAATSGGWAPARATGVAHRARHSTPAGAASFMRVRESVGRRIGGPEPVRDEPTAMGSPSQGRPNRQCTGHETLRATGRPG